MKIQHIALSILIAAGAGLAAPMSQAQRVGVDVRIGTAPPPPRYEPAPPPRRHYVWAPGYWAWDGHRHVWVGGHWERERRGYSRYEAPAWRQGPDGWRFNDGGWRR